MQKLARNSDVSPFIGKLSRSALYSKKGLYKRKFETAPAAAPAPAGTVEKTVGGKANGGKRLVPSAKAPAFYPSEDVRAPKLSRKTLKPTKLRSTITPGTVLILLAGRFRGKRVVFLKQLDSGLLLVTGPFKINGVPLRRVNQVYAIATSTKVDLGTLSIDAKLNDAYFSKEKSNSRSATEGEFFDKEKSEKKSFPAEKAQDQKTVDKEVIAAVGKTPNLAKYLGATFGLSKGQYPHLLKW